MAAFLRPAVIAVRKTRVDNGPAPSALGTQTAAAGRWLTQNRPHTAPRAEAHAPSNEERRGLRSSPGRTFARFAGLGGSRRLFHHRSWCLSPTASLRLATLRLVLREGDEDVGPSGSDGACLNEPTRAAPRTRRTPRAGRCSGSRPRSRQSQEPAAPVLRPGGGEVVLPPRVRVDLEP